MVVVAVKGQVVSMCGGYFKGRSPKDVCGVWCCVSGSVALPTWEDVEHASRSMKITANAAWACDAYTFSSLTGRFAILQIEKANGVQRWIDVAVVVFTGRVTEVVSVRWR